MSEQGFEFQGDIYYARGNRIGNKVSSGLIDGEVVGFDPKKQCYLIKLTEQSKQAWYRSERRASDYVIVTAYILADIESGKIR